MERKMLDKILYPTDFSDLSKKALAYIMGIQKIEVKEVVVLRVIDQIRTEFETLGISWAGKDVIEFFEDVNKKLERDALNELKPIKSKLKAAGFQVRSRGERGVPKLKILQVEKEKDVSTIRSGFSWKKQYQGNALGIGF
jgi:nucleotide-binding universal stress UspA family protein